MIRQKSDMGFLNFSRNLMRRPHPAGIPRSTDLALKIHSWNDRIAEIER
ncbi:hypothetical protein [Azospirillum sp. B510]|nr:hypothetical protein [Azospirillum sp. B510]